MSTPQLQTQPSVPLSTVARNLGYTPATLRGWIDRGWIIGATKGPNGRHFIPQAEADRLAKVAR